MRTIPLVLVFHVLFAATAFFSPRVVSAAGTDTAAASAVEDTQLLEVVPAGGAVVAPSHDNDNDNDSDAEVEQGGLQGDGGGAVAWAAEAAEAAVGGVEKTVRDIVSSFFEPEEKKEALEEEVVDASVPDGTAAAAAAVEVEDSDSLVLQEAAMNEATEMHGEENEEEEQEEEASDVVLETTTTETIFLYDDDGGGGALGEEEVEEGEQSYLIIMSTEEEEEREEQQVPVVTTVTTSTTTTTTSSSTITTAGTTTEEEETSVFTMTETTVEEGAAEQQAEAASIDGDVVIFSIGSDNTDEDTAADRLAVLTAGNGVSLSGDVPSDGWQLLEQRQVDAAYDELLNLEAETRPHSNIFTEWDGGGWPRDDNVAGPGDGAGYFVGPDNSASNIVSLEDLSVSSSLVRSLLPTTWWDSFGVSAGTRAGDTPFRRRGPMPGSVTLIFTDDQWPTPLYSTRWTLSVDLVGLSICALSLTIVIVIVFGLFEDEKEEEEQQQQEEQHDEDFDEERGVSLSDVREEERETLLNAPEPVTPKPSKSADTAKKGADTEYLQEPPVWTNPCATWDDEWTRNLVSGPVT